MSQDYTYSKEPLSAVYPLYAKDTGPFERLEPMLTPELLKQRHLFGITLISSLIDPATKRKQTMTDEILKDYMNGAISDIENDSSTCIMPAQFNLKLPYDRNLYLSYGFLQIPVKPVYSIDKFTVCPANNQDVFELPLAWLEASNLAYGQINLIPIGIALNGTMFGGQISSSGGGAGAAAFLAILAQATWVPAFWRIEVSCGYKDGMVPRYINELIGIYTSIRVLSELQATKIIQGGSIGVDGISQSVSTAGPQTYQARIEELKEEKKRKLKVLKKIYGGSGSLCVGNI